MMRLDDEAKPVLAGCPGGESLLDLLEGRLAKDDHARLVGHLDRCAECRTRLEELVGGDEFWLKAARNLRESAADALEEPSGLKALMPTRTCLADDTHAPCDDEPSLEFLAPCEKPDRLGRLDRYEILAVLGRGGMGLVLKAYDPGLDRVVAIKVLASPLIWAPKARARFRREARLAAAVRSEHTVTIHSVEETGEFPYLVMEYVPGTSLQKRIDHGGSMEVDDVLRLGAQIARGLAAAHAQGLIHRDVKPANILLEDGTGSAKITDFGLARAIDDAGLTRAHAVAGTPEYMAPEQTGPGSVDHRADLFSLGSVLYAMCTGRPPFCAEGSLAVLQCVREQTPPSVCRIRPDIPEALMHIVEKLHRKDPALRYHSAAEVAAALEGLWGNPRAALGDGTAKASPAVAHRASPCGSGRKRNRAGRLVLVASLLVAISFGVSEVTGFSGVFGKAVTLLGLQAPAPSGAEATQPPVAEPSREPVRVQVLPPDALLREAIQAEKDKLADEPSPWLIRKLEGHTGPVSGVAFSPDGKTILSCSGWPEGDRTVRLWDVASGEEVRQFQTASMPKNPGISGSREAPGELFCLAFAPDGKQAITGSTGGSVCVWDVDSGAMLRRFEGHTGTVYAVAVSSDGRRALTGGRDMTARLWDVQTGEEILRMPCHNSWVRSVAISPDGWRALTGSYDNVLRLWDLETGQELRKLKANNHWVWSVAFSPSGRRAVSASGNLIHLWDLEQGKVLRCYKGHLSGVTCVAFSPSGRRLLSASYDSTMRLWDVETAEQRQVFRANRGWVWSVAFSPDGRRAVSAGGGRHSPTGNVVPGSDFVIRLWKLP